MKKLGIGILCLLLGACASMEPPVDSAEAKMLNTHGDNIGSATLVEEGDGVRLHMTATFLEPGQHGLHVHQGGSCLPPAFESAEGHFNPDDREHGFNVPGGPHAGDVQNLEVEEDGTTEVDRMLPGVYLHAGSRSILGKTIVIHSQADDYTSQPSGDAGERVACGVIENTLFEGDI